MQLPAGARRPAIIAVVVIGAVASIATSERWTPLHAAVLLPAAQLSQAHPIATYRIRATGKGSATTARADFTISASTSTAPAPILFRVSSSYSPDPDIADFEGTSGSAFININCRSLPCSDDVLVHLELRPHSNGTWPAPSEWTLLAELDLAIPGQDPPPGALATLELVP